MKKGKASMRRGSRANSSGVGAAVAALAILVGVSSVACGSEESSDDSRNPNGPNGPNGPNTGTPKTPEEQVKQILDARQTDYGEAARTASLKLRDELPTMEEIKQIEGAADPAAKKAAYEKLVDTWINDPKFAKVMVKYWKDTFRTGQQGAVQMGQPNKDLAANFAARLVVDGKSFNDVFTATTNTCPTFDPATNAFTDGNCATTPTAGILTDPGIQAQYFANMAFRRVRFIQETFACSKFPAEYSSKPTPMGAGTYTGTVDFNQLTGKKNTATAKIDFQDTSSVICANCHANLNRLAPLFINYDDKGILQPTSQVEVPVPGAPKAKLEDYLQPGATLAWRAGKDVTDIPSLGAAIAADPEVARCTVNRVWNYAMSRGDIVNDLATVPNAVTEAYVKDYAAGGFKLKDTIRAVFKSEDFTKF